MYPRHYNDENAQTAHHSSNMYLHHGHPQKMQAPASQHSVPFRTLSQSQQHTSNPPQNQQARTVDPYFYPNQHHPSHNSKVQQAPPYNPIQTSTLPPLPGPQPFYHQYDPQHPQAQYSTAHPPSQQPLRPAQSNLPLKPPSRQLQTTQPPQQEVKIQPFLTREKVEDIFSNITLESQFILPVASSQTANGGIIIDGHYITLPMLRNAIFNQHKAKNVSHEMATKVYDKLQNFSKETFTKQREMQEESELMRARVQTFKADVQLLKEQRNGLLEEVDSMGKKNELLQGKLAEQTAIIDFLKKNEKDLVSKIDPAKQTVLNMEAKYDEKVQEIYDLNIRINALIEERTNLMAKLTTSQSTIASLEKELTAQGKNQSDSKGKLKEKINSLERELNDREATLLAAQERIRDLKRDNALAKAQRDSDKTYQMKHNHQDDELRQQLRELQSMNEEFKKMSKKYDTMTDELKQSKKEIKRLNKQVQQPMQQPIHQPIHQPIVRKPMKPHNTYALTHSFNQNEDEFDFVQEDSFPSTMMKMNELHSQNQLLSSHRAQKPDFLTSKTAQPKIQRFSTIQKSFGMLSDFEGSDKEDNFGATFTKTKFDKEGEAKGEKKADLQKKTNMVLNEVSSLISTTSKSNTNSKSLPGSKLTATTEHSKPLQSPINGDFSPPLLSTKRKSPTQAIKPPTPVKSTSIHQNRDKLRKFPDTSSHTTNNNAKKVHEVETDDHWSIPNLDEVGKKSTFSSNDVLIDDLGNTNLPKNHQSSDRTSQSTKSKKPEPKGSKSANSQTPSPVLVENVLKLNDDDDDDDNDSIVIEDKGVKKQRQVEKKSAKTTKSSKTDAKPNTVDENQLVQLTTTTPTSMGVNKGDNKFSTKAAAEINFVTLENDELDDLLMSDEIISPTLPSSNKQSTLNKKSSPSLFTSKPTSHSPSILTHHPTPAQHSSILTTTSKRSSLTMKKGLGPEDIAQTPPPNPITTTSTASQRLKLSSARESVIGASSDDFEVDDPLNNSSFFSTAPTIASQPGATLFAVKPLPPASGGANAGLLKPTGRGLGLTSAVGSSNLLTAGKRVLPLVSLKGVHLAPNGSKKDPISK